MSLHHLHKRKRVSNKKLEPYPSPRALKRFMDRVIYLAAILGPAAMIPQIIQIYETKEVAGQSLTMWTLWLILSFLWVFYGMLHKELPIILAQGTYVVFNLIMIVFILAYA